MDAAKSANGQKSEARFRVAAKRLETRVVDPANGAAGRNAFSGGRKKSQARNGQFSLPLSV